MVFAQEVLNCFVRSGYHCIRDIRTSKTPTAVLRRSIPSLERRVASNPLYSPCMIISIKASKAVAVSILSHSSPFVSGTGMYGVRCSCGRSVVAPAGRRRRHCSKTRYQKTAGRGEELHTWTLSLVGAFEAKAISIRSLVNA